MHRRLRSLYAAIEQEQETQARLEIDLASGSREIERKKLELEQQIKKTAGLAAMLEERKRTIPNIGFILDERDSMTPWLLEVTDKRLRVATKDGTSAVLEFVAKDFDTRRKSFAAWAKTQSKSKHYFVLLIKPSGRENIEKVFETIKGLGFDVGVDLLPENWRPF